jgi:hypothetical protein
MSFNTSNVASLSCIGSAPDAPKNWFDWLYNKIASPLIQIYRDPLVLDLAGAGLSVSALGQAGQTGSSTTYFDFNGMGVAERTAWIGAANGILVDDANANGRVDGAAELFGSATQDGFNVLESYDSNHDNVIDANDAHFGRLRVWRDLNGDGVVQDGEMQTLADAGVASISLARAASGAAIGDSSIGPRKDLNDAHARAGHNAAATGAVAPRALSFLAGEQEFCR